MRGGQLGEFEELVLLSVAILSDDAYAITVFDDLKKQTGRKMILSSVHKTLLRLEDKAFLKSAMGKATASRGGRMKRLYTLTPAGLKVMTETRELRNSMWQQIPKINLLGHE